MKKAHSRAAGGDKRARGGVRGINTVQRSYLRTILMDGDGEGGKGSLRRVKMKKGLK